MGTRYVRTNRNLGVINSTKLITVGTNDTTLTIGSGNVAVEATNLGPQTIFYGNTAVLANSGGIILVNAAKFWDSVFGAFIIRFATSTGSSNLLVHEYAGN